MIAFDTRGIERTIRGIKRFRLSVPNIVGDELVAQVVEFAASSRNPDGSTWSPLQKKYAALKQAKYGNQLPNKCASGAFLASVKNRGMIIGPDAAHMAQGRGLEKKRVSFQVSPITVGNIERLLLNAWNNMLSKVA